MTIAKTGPAGYEHQYRISVLMGLLFENDDPQLFIDSVGEEDATLRLQQDGHPSKIGIEIQIKSSKKAVDIQDVAEILATFPKGKFEDSLLERLLSHPDSMAFLFFGGRCKDLLSSLVVPLNRLPSRPRTSDSLNKDQSKQLLNAFGTVYREGKDTPLLKARNTRCAELAGSTRVDTVKALARRVFVIEQAGSEQVLDEIQRVLVKNLRVPEAIARKLADAPLRRHVETARDTGSDCRPLLLAEISLNQSAAICPRQPYIVHEHEDALYNELGETQVLLLTGLPLSGKTQLAHSLAQRVQAQGANVLKSMHVHDAYRFLLDPAEGESRLVLLEDPFGKLQLSRDGVEDWNRLVELISELKPHRKLIVTSRNDVLAVLRGSTEASDWNMEGLAWLDMETYASRTLVKDAWVAWATVQKRDEAEIKALSERLASDAFASLQPGHASFLAREHKLDYRQLRDLEIIALARKEAAELSRELCSTHHSKFVLRGLGASATTLNGPDETTLAFILDNETHCWPGRRSEEPFAEATSLPRINASRLRTESIEVLGAFESRGVIEWNGERCRFTHPLWEESAVQALLDSGHFAKQDRERLFRNAFYCADVACSRNAVGALARTCLGSSVGCEISPDMVTLMLDSTESIFPRVGDAAVAFLLDNLDKVPPPSKIKIIETAGRETYSSDRLSWVGDVAFFSKSAGRFELIGWLENGEKQRRRLETLCKSARVKDLSAEQLLEIYKIMHDYNVANIAHLERGVGVEEAIVRAEAYHLIVRHHHQARPDLVARGLADPHPEVVSRTMVGLALAWPSVASEQRKEWLRLLSTKLQRIGFGFVALQRLTAFRRWSGVDSDWYDGTTASWDYWCACMISALSTDPGYFGLDDAKIYDLIKQAIDKVPVPVAVDLCGAWLDWTERSISYGSPSDYGGAMAELLFRATHSNASAREDLVFRMVQQTDTALQMMLLRDLCRKWSHLSLAEQGEIVECLRSFRADVRWLKAVVVADGEAPLDVLEEITGCRDPLSLTPAEVAERFPEQLLHDVLHVFCGYPSPLWSIGTHHVNEEFWKPVLMYIGGMPEHALFDLAIREILCRDDEDPDGLRMWEQLCRTNDAATLDRIFRELLKWSIRITAASLAQYWWLLVRSPMAVSLLDDWGRRVADEIEALNCSDNAEIVLEQICEALEYLPGERRVVMENSAIFRAEETGELDSREARSRLASMARTVLEKEPPRGYLMLDWLISLVKANSGNDSSSVDQLLESAELKRSSSMSKGFKRIRSLVEDDFELPGWNRQSSCQTD